MSLRVKHPWSMLRNSSRGYLSFWFWPLQNSLPNPYDTRDILTLSLSTVRKLGSLWINGLHVSGLCHKLKEKKTWSITCSAGLRIPLERCTCIYHPNVLCRVHCITLYMYNAELNTILSQYMYSRKPAYQVGCRDRLWSMEVQTSWGNSHPKRMMVPCCTL